MKNRPIRFGTGGGRVADPERLVAAARRAEDIGYSTFWYKAKIDHIKAVAGERFNAVELGTQLLLATVTDDPERSLEEFAVGYRLRGDDLRASPLVAVGSLSEVCERLQAVRDDYGISYFACPVGVKASSLAPIIEKVAGT